MSIGVVPNQEWHKGEMNDYSNDMTGKEGERVKKSVGEMKFGKPEHPKINPNISTLSTAHTTLPAPRFPLATAVVAAR